MAQTAQITERLTSRQIEALNAAFEKGGAWYGIKGSRAGGAYSRLCDRLAERGLVDDNAPYSITTYGLQALRSHRNAQWGKSGSMADLTKLEAIDAAIAALPAAETAPA